ncbi:unnamed protein product, partial [Trichogramma brassicae]
MSLQVASDGDEIPFRCGWRVLGEMKLARDEKTHTLTRRRSPVLCFRFWRLKIQTLDDGFAKASDVSAKSSEMTLLPLDDAVHAHLEARVEVWKEPNEPKKEKSKRREGQQRENLPKQSILLDQLFISLALKVYTLSPWAAIHPFGTVHKVQIRLLEREIIHLLGRNKERERENKGFRRLAVSFHSSGEFEEIERKCVNERAHIIGFSAMIGISSRESAIHILHRACAPLEQSPPPPLLPSLWSLSRRKERNCNSSLDLKLKSYQAHSTQLKMLHAETFMYTHTNMISIECNAREKNSTEADRDERPGEKKRRREIRRRMTRSKRTHAASKGKGDGDYQDDAKHAAHGIYLRELDHRYFNKNCNVTALMQLLMLYVRYPAVIWHSIAWYSCSDGNLSCEASIQFFYTCLKRRVRRPKKKGETNKVSGISGTLLNALAIEKERNEERECVSAPKNTNRENLENKTFREDDVIACVCYHTSNDQNETPMTMIQQSVLAGTYDTGVPIRTVGLLHRGGSVICQCGRDRVITRDGHERTISANIRHVVEVVGLHRRYTYIYTACASISDASLSVKFKRRGIIVRPLLAACSQSRSSHFVRLSHCSFYIDPEDRDESRADSGLLSVKATLYYTPPRAHTLALRSIYCCEFLVDPTLHYSRVCVSRISLPHRASLLSTHTSPLQNAPNVNPSVATNADSHVQSFATYGISAMISMTCSGIKNIARGKILHSRVPSRSSWPTRLKIILSRQSENAACTSCILTTQMKKRITDDPSKYVANGRVYFKFVTIRASMSTYQDIVYQWSKSTCFQTRNPRTKTRGQCDAHGFNKRTSYKTSYFKRRNSDLSRRGQWSSLLLHYKQSGLISHAPAPLLLLQLTNAVVSLFYLICRAVPSEKARRDYIRARDRFPVVLQEQRRLLLITDIALAKLGKSVWPVPRADLLGIPNHQFLRRHIDEGTRVGTRDANARCNQRQLTRHDLLSVTSLHISGLNYVLQCVHEKLKRETSNTHVWSISREKSWTQ